MTSGGVGYERPMFTLSRIGGILGIISIVIGGWILMITAVMSVVQGR